MNRRDWRWLASTAVVALACLPALGQSDSSKQADKKLVAPGFTMPNKTYSVCVRAVGIIKEMKVQEGSEVNVDDVILIQDTSEDKAELEILKADAANTLPIEAAAANIKAKKAEFDAKDRLKGVGGGAELEWIRAKAELEIAEVQLKQAKEEIKLKELKRDKQQERVNNMTLKSLTKGVVEKLAVEVGTNIDPTKPVLSLVDNQPLKVQVQVPALASLKMKKGDEMRVSYTENDWSNAKTAKVSFMSPQANAAAGTRLIQLEMDNGEKHPSGLRVYVELPNFPVVVESGK